MIKEDIFKGVKALILENERLKVIVHPEVGGKIASIYRKDKDFELVFQNKDKVYNVPKIYDAFHKFDASGFDDAFPSIDSCSVEVNGRIIEYPDHGEIWTAQFEYEIKDDHIIMKYKSCILPYTYEKIISLEENKIAIHYNITNTGEYSFPCIWAAHYLVNCHEDMELIFPRDTVEVLNVQQSKRLGEVNKIHAYPKTIDMFSREINLNRVQKIDASNTEKYYVNGKIAEGKCSIYYPHRDITYSIEYDEEMFPYLGFWVTEGGFRGDYNCAFEPTNGFYDSIEIAEKNNKLFYLEKNSKIQFKICVIV